MSDTKTFFTVHDNARRNIADYAWMAPHGWLCTFSPPKKKRIQEEKYHAMCGDISRQCEHIARKWDLDDWKRILVDEFAYEMRLAGTPLAGSDLSSHFFLVQHHPLLGRTYTGAAGAIGCSSRTGS